MTISIPFATFQSYQSARLEAAVQQFSICFEGVILLNYLLAGKFDNEIDNLMQSSVGVPLFVQKQCVVAVFYVLLSH